MEEKKIGLRELREEAGKTIADVAKALGVSEWAIKKYENGLRHISIEQVLCLAELFSVDAETVIRAQLNEKQVRVQEGSQPSRRNSRTT